MDPRSSRAEGQSGQFLPFWSRPPPTRASLVPLSDFRFGLQVLGASGHDELADTARRAENLGFFVLTVADHLIDGCIAPFVALAVAADATSNLRVGTLVLNNDLRHPALVAREVLTLDSMSGGRAELGLGAGHGFPEYESIGVPFDAAPTRVARLGEAVAVLDDLLRGDTVTSLGEHYRISEHRAWPSPTQQPRLPILVGGNGRRLLRMAAERADIVALSGTGRTKADGLTHEATGFPPGAVDERIALVRAAAAGREVELQALVQQVIVTDDRRTAAERVRERVPELSVDDVLATPYLWIGSVESICEDLLAARERWGFSYFTVFEHSLQAAIPVVARLAAT
jgi:probable F420-dependent oxidoreductase